MKFVLGLEIGGGDSWYTEERIWSGLEPKFEKQPLALVFMEKQVQSQILAQGLQEMFYLQPTIEPIWRI